MQEGKTLRHSLFRATFYFFLPGIGMLKMPGPEKNIKNASHDLKIRFVQLKLPKGT